MRKGWLYYSLIIGIAAMLIAFTILALANTVSAGQNQMLDQLSKDGTLGSITFDMYTLANAPFFLAMIGFLLLELLCGMLTFLFTRSADKKTENKYVASMVAGLLPALVFCSFMLNNWRNTVSQYETHTNVRPGEPAPDFIVYGMLIFFTIFFVLVSAAGGWLAKVALKRDLNDK
jgi:hypothetical protein